MRNLAISNIGWTLEQDETIYSLMGQNGFTGLEIAPTRIFPEQPYDRLQEAAQWALGLKARYGFTVPSIQSIWFGRQEKLFEDAAQRKILTDYTKQAIDFAAAIGCGSLVFGCPRNRQVPEDMSPWQAEDIAVSFFRELGDYALDQGTAVSMEANPPIYNTNYINTTADALSLVKAVDREGFRLNLDLGTMIHNGESLELLRGNVSLVRHVHISEPGLKPIMPRQLHKELLALLAEENYQGFVSIEMGKQENLQAVTQAMAYVGGL